MSEPSRSAPGRTSTAPEQGVPVIRIRSQPMEIVTPREEGPVRIAARAPGGFDPLHRIHPRQRHLRSSHGRPQAALEVRWRLGSHPGLIRLPGAGGLLMEN
jgi:hypothetical protein